MTSTDEETLRIFEPKIIRRIYGYKKVGNDEQVALIYFEIVELLEREDIVKVIRSMRARWFRHVLRREDKGMPKKIMKQKLEENRPKERLKATWEEQVIKDISHKHSNRRLEDIDNRQKKWKKIANIAKMHNNLS